MLPANPRVELVRRLVACLLLIGPAGGMAAAPARPRAVSGIYPHLAMFNDERECGTGAVVPWAGRLWVVTYASHAPRGSSDKLYEITDQLEQIVRPESVGGTPADRLIHRESNQLFIGPYAIDAQRRVRVIPPAAMPGRLTGAARHLLDPAHLIYVATMEEGFYEVDVNSLAVTELYRDANLIEGAAGKPDLAGPLLPGYHGKGLYSGQGRLVYANNGEYSELAQARPDIESGVLAEWDGAGWRVVRRNQFTEVTGPGGICGGAGDPASDPIWSIGWDHRSLILMARDGGAWHAYRLPKASHAYDGAHGWNTEWPRIRDVGEDDLLMTMHGTFWRFPRHFDSNHSAGVAPRSSYLKVIGDFCRWNDRLVFGCDDAAKSAFLNRRNITGPVQSPGQSQSNLWLVPPGKIDHLGPALGRGAVWLNDAVKANSPSDPYMFCGYQRRSVCLWHGATSAVTFRLEVDRDGDGRWTGLREVTVPPDQLKFVAFPRDEPGAWLRVTAKSDCAGATAFFQYSNDDGRGSEPAEKFAGLAKPSDEAVGGGLVYALGDDRRALGMALVRPAAAPAQDQAGYYELDGQLRLTRRCDAASLAAVRAAVPMSTEGITVDDASVLVVDDAGRRWRFPKGDAAFDRPGPLGGRRACREVCTERDLLNLHGTFYELPAENAGGFAKVRPVATHNRAVYDYCSYRGLLVLTGLSDGAPASEHVIRSDDGRASVWVGAVDDLWELGKPVGHGGPWKNARVTAGRPSDAYLMTGYDRKRIELSHDAAGPVTITLEVDVTGTGSWKVYRSFSVKPGETAGHVFPDSFAAYWIRVRADRDCRATAWLVYE